MAVKIYFCGEVVADLLEEKQGSDDFKFHRGGSQFHSAMGARRAVVAEQLDFGISFVGPMSRDTFGERFFATLEEAGVDTGNIKRVERNTTLAIVSIRPGKENDFSFYGRDTAEQMTKIEELPGVLGNAGDSKICCLGSISTVMEPARFAWLEFAKKQREHAVVFYDLNTRPKIAKDPENYRRIVAEWARTMHVMKASDADIAWAYPGKSTKEVADIWLKEGALLAVFTKGNQGSEAYTRNVSASADSIGLETYNTVGAGDNFNAGFAINLAKNGITTPQAITQISETQLRNILQGANNTAVNHLIRIGAKERIKTVPGPR